MSFIETIKAAGEVVVEAVKENPVVAGCAVAGTLAVGGGIYLYKRNKDKEVEERVKAVIREYTAADAGETVAAPAQATA